MLLDSIAASFSRPGVERARSFTRFRETYNRVFANEKKLPPAEEIKAIHDRLASTDLDRLGERGRQQLGKTRTPSKETKEAWEALKAAAPALDCLTNLDELLRQSRPRTSDPWPLFFSTRPLGAPEVSLLDPKAQKNLGRLCRWLGCLRGNHTTHEATATPAANVISVGWRGAPAKPRVAITSYLTTPEAWKSRVRGRPLLSLERFKSLIRLVRETSKLEPRPHYVVFPELSIPREWVMEVAGSLQRSGISLIAGVEYEVSKAKAVRQCHNPAFLILRTTDLGYTGYRLIRQDKTIPAPGEEQELWRISKLTLRPKVNFDYGFNSEPDSPRPIFKHGQLHFGLLICNELTNIDYRSKFRGQIDALFVLEWNQDLKSFAPLVEAAALDIHCYVVQVNNRLHGDSRIRVPAKRDWERDVVRLQGGLNDYQVVGEINIKALRDFQSDARSSLDDDAPFKPVPTGFVISGSRSKNSLLDND
jgi:predicted amidohydrolase